MKKESSLKSDRVFYAVQFEEGQFFAGEFSKREFSSGELFRHANINVDGLLVLGDW